MDVPIADMSNSDAVEIVLFAKFRNLFGDIGNLIEGNDEIFRLEHLVDVAGRFSKLLAQLPNTLIGFKFVDRPIFFGQIAELFHLAVRIVFTEGFDGDDDVVAASSTWGIFISKNLQVMRSASLSMNSILVGSMPAFKILFGRAEGFFIGLEYADHIEGIRRHGAEFDRDFRNDAEDASEPAKSCSRQRPVEHFFKRAPASRISPVGVTTFRL